jgi:phosphotriesterase-related protein
MGLVYTLNGPIDAADLGPVLPHEHLPLHYHGQDDDEFEPGSKYLVREWYARILDDLQATPFHTLVDVTMIGHGRDIRFRKELLAHRPINVIMATGFYIDSNQPEWAKEKSAEECEEFMVRELAEGIGNSGVKAGIIKIAPDPDSGQSRKICRAAARASLATGARITTHADRNVRRSFDLLTDFGVPPENIYIGHADFAEYEENAYVCSRGGHVLFTVWDIDYMIPGKLMYQRFVELVHAGFTDRVLMSVDFAIMVHHGKQPTFLSWTLYGVERRTHDYLHNKVIPTLKTGYGLTDEELRIITIDNPRRMLDFRGT